MDSKHIFNATISSDDGLEKIYVSIEYMQYNGNHVLYDKLIDGIKQINNCMCSNVCVYNNEK